MKKVCQLFQNPTFTRPASLIGFKPSSELKLVCLNFIRLQEARHSADYDLSSQWTRANAEHNVNLGRDAFNAWTKIKRSEEANLFILALLNWKNFESDRS